ncbi:hypothetical protein OROMI_026039 [Orobanche minor]
MERVSVLMMAVFSSFIIVFVGVTTVYAGPQEDVLLEFKRNITFTNDSPLYAQWPCGPNDDRCPPPCRPPRCSRPCDPNDKNDPECRFECHHRHDHQCTVSCDPDDYHFLNSNCTCEAQQDEPAGCVQPSQRPSPNACDFFDGYAVNWRGVGCGDNDGNVTRLDLGRTGLWGPADSITGLLRLPKLYVLMLYNNNFTGQVSDDVKKIRCVDLTDNPNLTGPCTQDSCIQQPCIPT